MANTTKIAFNSYATQRIRLGLKSTISANTGSSTSCNIYNGFVVKENINFPYSLTNNLFNITNSATNILYGILIDTDISVDRFSPNCKPILQYATCPVSYSNNLCEFNPNVEGHRYIVTPLQYINRLFLNNNMGSYTVSVSRFDIIISRIY